MKLKISLTTPCHPIHHGAIFPLHTFESERKVNSLLGTIVLAGYVATLQLEIKWIYIRNVPNPISEYLFFKSSWEHVAGFPMLCMLVVFCTITPGSWSLTIQRTQFIMYASCPQNSLGDHNSAWWHTYLKVVALGLFEVRTVYILICW